MTRHSIRLRIVLGTLALSSTVCLAQVDRAGLNGTVRDVTGRRIGGVHVEVVSLDTGLRREVITSPGGTYGIAELPIGRYSVRCEAAGFAQAVFPIVEQTVGQTRTLDVTLTVAGVLQRVDVSDVAPLLDETSAVQGARIERQQVEQLPLNGRNWATLTVLAPGAVDTGGSNQRSIRFAGRGLDDNNFTYDGVDATNIVNQAQQPFVRLALPTESIQEFRVNTALFTAENGSTPGGQVAVASKSGTNTLHGSAFEFLRNDGFDARQPIDTVNPHKPAFRLNQFGGSLGGSLRKDAAFVFATYEGLRQTLGQTLPGFVPSDADRARIAATPALLPILGAYPRANRVPSGARPYNFVGSGRQLDQEDSGMVRIDHRFRAADSVYGRFNFDASTNSVPLVQGGSYLTSVLGTESRPANGELEHLHLFSSTLLNEEKFGYNRGNVYTTNASTLGLPYAVMVSGLTTLPTNQYKLGVGNSFSVIDNATHTRGAHTVKAGVEVRRIQLNQGNTASGTVAFSSIDNLVKNKVSSASYAAELPINGLRKTQVYAYVQDEWKLRPELTVNLGVRYSFYNQFHEVLSRAIPFDFGSCGPGGFCGAGAEFGSPNSRDVDPRVAVTWAPNAAHGRTVLRGGFGLYHGDGQLDDQNLPINNEVARYNLSAVANLSFPVTPYLSTVPGIVSPRDMDRNRNDMYVSQWGLSVQQSLPAALVGTLAYSGSKGTHLLTTSYLNLRDPATHSREHPQFGQVEYRGNGNNSSYEALAGTLQRSFSRGLVFSANYTYSHEIDQDSAGGGDADFPQDPACLACERASGDFDVRHVFNANAVYELPFGRGKRWANAGGFRGAVLSGWSTTTIVSARSALPVNVTVDRSSSSVATGYTTNQRPRLVAGVPLTPPGGRGIGQWINAGAFSTAIGPGYGDTPRNPLRGPALWQADLGLGKQIALSERAQLQFRSEIFNFLNRAQYGLPLADVSSAGSFGRIISTVNTGPVGTGTPRQMQFVLRLQF